MSLKNMILSVFVLVCGLSGTAALAADVEFKLATVSMEKLFDEYYRTQTYNAELKKSAKLLEDKRDKLVLDAKSKQRQLEVLAEEARDRSLSEKARENKKREVEDAYKDARAAEEAVGDFDHTEKRRFSEEMRNAQQELVREIRAKVHDYAVQHGYTLVLDVSGKTLNGVETLVYHDPGFDITVQVLEILNKKGK